MKRILIASFLSAGAIAALAQGTIEFQGIENSGSQQVVFHIYAPQFTGDTVEQIGNATTLYQATLSTVGGDDPVGGTVETLPGASSPTTFATANWSGYTAIGGTSAGGTSSLPPNYAAASQFTVGLLAAAGDSASLSPQDPSQFIAVSGVAFYNTSTLFGGLLNGNTTITVPVLANGAAASDYHSTIAVVAWWNGNGTISFAQAVTTPGDVWGMSNPVNMDDLGEPASITGSVAGNPEYLVGVESFSMQTTTATPEPATVALGLMGVCGFLARRRKK